MQMVDRNKSARDMELERDCRAMSKIKFYPVAENWNLIKRHVEDEDVRQGTKRATSISTPWHVLGSPLGLGNFLLTLRIGTGCPSILVTFRNRSAT